MRRVACLLALVLLLNSCVSGDKPAPCAYDKRLPASSPQCRQDMNDLLGPFTVTANTSAQPHIPVWSEHQMMRFTDALLAAAMGSTTAALQTQAPAKVITQYLVTATQGCGTVSLSATVQWCQADNTIYVFSGAMQQAALQHDASTEGASWVVKNSLTQFGRGSLYALVLAAYTVVLQQQSAPLARKSATCMVGALVAALRKKQVIDDNLTNWIGGHYFVQNNGSAALIQFGNGLHQGVRVC